MKRKVAGVLAIIGSVVFLLLSAIAIPGYRSLSGPNHEALKMRVINSVLALSGLGFASGVYLVLTSKPKSYVQVKSDCEDA